MTPGQVFSDTNRDYRGDGASARTCFADCVPVSWRRRLHDSARGHKASCILGYSMDDGLVRKELGGVSSTLNRYSHDIG